MADFYQESIESLVTGLARALGIEEPMLRFLRKDGTVGSESGEFQIWISNSSENGQYKNFQLILN